MTLDSNTRHPKRDEHAIIRKNGTAGDHARPPDDLHKCTSPSSNFDNAAKDRQSYSAPDYTTGPTGFAARRLDGLQKAGLYRTLRHGITAGQYIIIDGKKMINLCSNDYLGMGGLAYKHDKGGGGSVHDMGRGMGQIQASSRLLSGGDPIHEALERDLAESKCHDSALVYPTGYMANTGVIPVIAQGSSVIFSDAYNHASIIDGCRLARDARTITYQHNSAKDLESKIAMLDSETSSHDNSMAQKSAAANNNGIDGVSSMHDHTNPPSRAATPSTPAGRMRKIIITEGVFSMDGDIAPLRQISDIAQKHNAMLVVDDAHGDFVLGERGGGTPEHLGLGKSGRFNEKNKVHVYTSSLSKGLGSFGGYVASDHGIIDMCINYSRQFIYTSALPSYVAHHAHCRLMAKDLREERRGRLLENIRIMKDAITAAGYQTDSNTHIMPIRIGDERRALEIAKHLYLNGIYAPAIRYPTVPRGEARLRISVTAWLDENDMAKIASVLAAARPQ